jgi:hypothetical protein
VNGFVSLAAMYSVTSFDGLGQPWDKLSRRLSDFEVNTTWLGGIYIARGTYSPHLH